MAEHREGAREGFSLIEIIVAVAIVSILAGALAPFVAQQVRSAREDATRERMERIYRGMVGDPARGQYGYLGDMGQLPPRLIDLTVRGSQPVWSMGAAGVGTGWNGPYVVAASAAAEVTQDAWGTVYQYASGTPRLTSAGADRRLGTSDDLGYPATAPPTQGSLVVSVRGLPNTGPPTLNLDPASVAGVQLAFSNAGVAATLALAWNGTAWVGSGIHRGLHPLTVTGRGAYGTAVASDVVSIHAGSNARTLTLVQP
ncbi:MAG: prepilin-type N-terminal cleavage/methylation domain-containing protein [Myxococcota bacterium]